MAAERWTILSILKWTEDYFKKHGLDNPRFDAELLLAHILKLERLRLYLEFERPLSEQELAEYKVMIKRRVNHEPVQYITGEAWFLGLKFLVDPRVLIPRFDTEVLVEQALQVIKTQNITKVIDVGTGSGAIAISIGHFITDIPITAIDISSQALDVARTNAETYGLSQRITFKEGDLLSPCLTDIKPEDRILITANLPYVREKEWEVLSREVKEHEPRTALVSGEDGLEHYRRLVDTLAEIKIPYVAILEIGIDQAQAFQRYIPSKFQNTTVSLIKDLNRKDRCVVIDNLGQGPESESAKV